MIACIIEFGIREGAEAERDRLVADLMASVVTIDGFISKETLVSRDKPGKLVTLSYWRDEEALRVWVRHPSHVRAVLTGKRGVFSYYSIQVSAVQRDINWAYKMPLYQAEHS